MIKLITIFSVFIFGFTSTVNEAERWGQNGHRTTGLIAEKYLTPQAAKEVKRILGDESLAEVSTWMDEVRSDRAYDHMTTWHYVTIPEGETYESADKEEAGDIIQALQNAVSELKKGNLSPEKENEYLKILVHLVGDLHQPLHVGNGTDRGGNDVKVEWFWEDSNLHRVWDSEMINDKQLSFTELTGFIDHASAEQIRDWQNSSILDWAYDSQSILPQVYDIPENRQLSYEYAYKNWETVELRLLKAGIRMAGLLNDIYG